MHSENIRLEKDKRIYFASDFHLGVPDNNSSLLRERKVVQWLDEIKHDAQVIFLLGDVFDFWFEYRKVVPKGFLRLLGKLAELADSGIEIVFFRGNHDMWMFNYFQEEFNARVFSGPVSYVINDKKLLISHGDGLGPGDFSYKILKKIFNNSICQWLFGILPPVIGLGIAQSWSKRSRIVSNSKGEVFKGEEKEHLVIWSRNTEQKTHHDYYIFGHRHLALDIAITNNSRYFNLGEWVNNSHYGMFDGENFVLSKYPNG